MNKKYTKIAVCCVLTIFFAVILAFPAAAKTNIAFECEIDSCCGKSAQMLVDDDKNYSTKWEASNNASHPAEPHWVILDFGAEKNFDSIRLVKASQGAGDFGRTEFDANGFIFEISSDKKSWVKILEIKNDGDNDIYEGFFTPASARYLKLTLTQPEQSENVSENQAVRLYDLKVFDVEFVVEDNGEILGIEPETVPLANITIPKTSDLNSLSLLFAVLPGVVISLIFLNRRSRSA